MRHFLCALLLLILSVDGSPVHAAAAKPSSPEDVIIALFKTADTQPDFDKFATAPREYRLTPVARQKAFVEKEKQRLMRAYREYDPDIHLLLVDSKILAMIDTTPGEDGQDSYHLTLSFSDNNSDIFFPYKFMDYDLALLPNRIDDLLRHPLTKEQYIHFSKLFEGSDHGQIALNLQLRPVQAYLDQPYMLAGKLHWALVTDIAGMIMRDPGGAILWSYSAPWYVSPVKQDVLDIYNDTQKRKQEMELENPLRPTPVMTSP